MRIILRGKYTSWKKDSGVAQDSLLALIRFLVYINDNLGTERYINMFADDAKIQNNKKNKNVCKELQNNLTM